MSRAHLSPDLRQLDLNLLRVFDVVSRERGLGRAAAALFVTPSAVSHAVSRLRELLGDPLFVRQGRGIVATPMAARLAPAVRDALGALDRALLERRGFDPGRDLLRLTLALPDELESLLLPPLLRRLRAASPALVLSAVRLDRPQLRADLAAGRVDAAFDVAQPTDEDVLHEPVFSDAFCVVSGPARRSLDREAYLRSGHVAVSSRPSGPALEDFRLAAHGVRRSVTVRCQRYETAFAIVAESDLLLTIPRRLAQARRQPPGPALRVFPPPIAIAPIEVHLYRSRRTDETPEGAWVRAALVEALSRALPAGRSGPVSAGRGPRARPGRPSRRPPRPPG